jgi:hypothetical protein
MQQRKTASSGLFLSSLLAIFCLSLGAFFVAACGDMTTTSGSGMGTVTTMISDPATCSAPDGPFKNVYVTITDVQANMSSSAGDNDGGWVDLTPNLKNSPKQIDLLGQANNQCFLASLGDSQQLQAGKYQQIRVVLADNSLNITGNLCDKSANCVVLNSDPSTPHPLQLSSEAKTGLKIPSGQIADGGFTIAAGQTRDLDIDFNTCASILQEGNGLYRLKPVLHAGEVSTTSASINGVVLDSSTGKPLAGMAWVAVEQKDASGVDRVIQSTVANPDGSFVFCPLPAGTFDVVIQGTRTSDGALYVPSIVTGVAVGSTTGNVNLHPPALAATSSFANLNGLVTSQNGAAAATSIDVTLTALETVNSVAYTIPQQPPASPFYGVSQVVTTIAGPVGTPPVACAVNTDCINYSLPVPSGGPYIGAWTSAGVTLTEPAPLATYVVDGTTTSSCTASGTELKSSPPLALAGAGPFTNVAITPNLAFTGCP